MLPGVNRWKYLFPKEWVSDSSFRLAAPLFGSTGRNFSNAVLLTTIRGTISLAIGLGHSR